MKPLLTVMLPSRDVFRWPAITNGTERMLLGLFITTLFLPGIPLLLWGEEQSLYLLADTSAVNYIFGRQPMSSALAWQLHGCFRLDMTGSDFYQLPLDAALRGCEDDLVGRDHRDPTHPVHNVITAMYALRRRFPILNDGLNLQTLSKRTHDVQLPGSNGTATETGMWSTVRNLLPGIQKFDDGNQSVWLVYHNEDHTVTYTFDCEKNDTALIAPFGVGTTVRNLLAPYEELRLQEGPKMKKFIDGSQDFNGCLEELRLDPWGFKAFVPVDAWTDPDPVLTAFIPGHDARLPSSSTLKVELHFSAKRMCDDVTSSITISSTTESKKEPEIDLDSISCSSISNANVPPFGAYIPSLWSWKATLLGVEDGVHTITLRTKKSSLDADHDIVNHLLFRVGAPGNPMVFPHTSNYSRDVYIKDANSGDLIVSHHAAGADQWRYSTNFASSWSPWMSYQGGGNSTIVELPWNGTRRQRWMGDHIILQYWSQKTASSAHVQHADIDWSGKPPRWFPNLYAQGPFNDFGYDSGLMNQFTDGDSDGMSELHLMTEWPTVLQINVWGGWW